MNQRRHHPAAAPRGATPRALAAPSSSSSSTSSSRQQQQRYTAADIDREIAASNEDDDDDDENDDSNEEDEEDDDVGNVEYDDADDDDAGDKVQQKKHKAAPRKRTRKSGYKPTSPTKTPKIKQRKQKQSTKKSKRREEIDSDDESDGDESEEDENESDEEYEEEDSEISNEDESDEDGDDDSDYGTSSKKISTRSKKNSRGVGGKRRTITPYTRSTTTTARSSSARSSSSRRRRSQRHPPHSSSNFSSDDDDDDDINEGTSGVSRGRGRPRRACKTQTELRMSEMVHKDMQSEKEAWGGVLEEDDRELLGLEGDVGGDDNENRNDDDEAESNVAAATNGRHASPKKSSKRTGIHDDDDDEDYDDAPSDTNNGEDDDDEGVGDDDNDDDDDLVTDDEIVSKQNQRRSSRNRRSMKNVDLSEEEIGTADEDSEDEETGPGVLMSPARKSSASRIGGRSPNASRARASARMGRKALDIKDDDDGEAHQSAGLHSATSLSSRKDVTMESLISCPSTTDEITMANLPKNKPHVCYISPDGRTRHCFALDTLYRIAISATNNRIDGGGGGGIDDIIIGSTQKLTFLQPPHFRSPMEDDLLDQIASRFGRAALNIEKSAIYKRMHGSIFSLNDDDELDDFDEDGEFIGYGSTIRSSSRRGNFQDRFERYIQSLMGSNDVYCCPLCYNEADRRLGNMGDEEMWEDDDDDDDEDDAAEGHKHSGEDCFSFMDDPMRILGSLDQDRYEVASTFCFRTLVDVKTHLKIVHQVNIKEVAGNDLYHRFQIRASDGLLQSWLKRNLGKTTVQGDMMRYWNQGENQSFVLLLSQIDKGVFEGEISGEYGSDFCQSFPNRAKRIWREVSAPYLKDQHDMGDFIAAEGEEESEEDADEGPTKVQGNSSLTPQDTPGEEGGNLKSPEDQIIEFLQKKQQSKKQKQNFFKQNANDSGNNEHNSSDESSDDDELEVLPKPQQFEEVEEEDEWIKSKHLKAKKRQKRRKSSRSSDEDSGANVFDSDLEIENPEANGSARKRIIDDDNSLGSDTADGRPNDASPTNNNGGSARKKVIESSDEESF